MQLVNEFVVPRPIDQTWAVLTDVERIAPAMPGAQLTDHVDDQYHGKVKVKVGPVTAQYAGVAQFKELDEAAHHMVLEATGKESSGRGRASALVSADLTDEGTQTRVKVVTDLTISGPLAQFGRGAIAEVSSKLLGQFVSNLETMVLADVPAAGTASDAAPTTAAPSASATAVAERPAAAEATAPVAATSASATPAPANATATPASANVGAVPSARPASGAPANMPESSAPAAAPQAPSSAPSVPVANRPQPGQAPAAEVNLLKVAAWPILKRVIPLLVVVAVIVILIVVFA